MAVKHVTEAQIRKRILDIWPHMKTTIRLYDPKYSYPTYQDVIDAVRKCPRHRNIPYTDYIADCDKKSLWLNADIKEYCATKINLNYTWPFGIVSGFIWAGEPRNHTGNIFLTEQSTYLIDSSDFDSVWEVNPKKDFMIEVRL